jgi:hypothetical protein
MRCCGSITAITRTDETKRLKYNMVRGNIAVNNFTVVIK